MRVYHFLNEKYGLEDINKQRLKISKLMDLNDPFEFLCVEMTDPIFRNCMSAGKNGIAEISGVLCFSRNWKNPVQWAHYADRHKGVCLGFNIPSSCLEKVTYVEKRIAHDGQMNEKLCRRLLNTKYIHLRALCLVLIRL
jgi:hypothetical protein